MLTENQIARRAIDLVNHAQLGVLMTRDERGYPHGRWMHMLSMNGLRRVYALTAAGSRKIAHIARHPEVAWIVSPEPDEVVLLKGRASVNPESMSLQDVWDRLAPATQRYAVGPLAENTFDDLVAIETVVEEAELISARLGLPAARAVRLDG